MGEKFDELVQKYYLLKVAEGEDVANARMTEDINKGLWTEAIVELVQLTVEASEAFADQIELIADSESMDQFFENVKKKKDLH